MPDNYRPVSLTRLICEISETIICDAMVRHLEENSKLTTWIQEGMVMSDESTDIYGQGEKLFGLWCGEPVNTIFWMMPMRLIRFHIVDWH